MLILPNCNVCEMQALIYKQKEACEVAVILQALVNLLKDYKTE